MTIACAWWDESDGLKRITAIADARAAGETKVRDMTHDAPVDPTVTARFAFPEVMQCASVGPYRPEGLRNHDSFKHLYPGSQTAPASSSSVTAELTSILPQQPEIAG